MFKACQPKGYRGRLFSVYQLPDHCGISEANFGFASLLDGGRG